MSCSNDKKQQHTSNKNNVKSATYPKRVNSRIRQLENSHNHIVQDTLDRMEGILKKYNMRSTYMP